MNFFVNVDKESFDVPISEFRAGAEFVNAYQKAAREGFNFESLNDAIVFVNGQKGFSFDFHGLPGPGKDPIPYKGRRIFSVTVYRFAEEHRIVQKKSFFQNSLSKPDMKAKNISVLLREVDFKKQEEPRPTEFRNRWGRERFDGEPGRPDDPWEGFLVQVFKPTPEDNGKVALGGYIFDPRIYPSLKSSAHILDTVVLRLSEEEKKRYETLKKFTREEVAERYILFGAQINKVLTIESFFDKKLPVEAMQLLKNKMDEYEIMVSPHPREGVPTLIARPENLSSANLKGRKNFYILAERNDAASYQKFVGQLTLKEKPGDIYRPLKTRRLDKNKNQEKGEGNER